MNTIAEDPNLLKFQNKIQKNINYLRSMKSYLRLPSIYIRICLLIYANRHNIAESRLLLEKCKEPYKINYQAEIKNCAIIIRNSLGQLLDAMSQKVVLAPLRFYVEKIFYDWDDIVEDTTICCDQECRELINELASRA